MMKIEVGMYVRIKKGRVNYIRKLLEIIHNFEEFNVYRADKEYFDYKEKDYFDIIYPEDIIEASYNIIDLIEVRDYVNDSKLLSIDYAEDEWGNCDKTRFYYSFEDCDKDVNEYNEKLIIKSIVTKEQFESMSYKIGE